MNYIVLGPVPAPTAEELVQAVKARIPGAKIDFQVNEQVSKLIDSVTGRPFGDRYARTEWGWKHNYDLSEIIKSFLAVKNIPDVA